MMMKPSVYLETSVISYLTSRPLRPSPMFLGLIKAAAEYAKKRG